MEGEKNFAVNFELVRLVDHSKIIDPTLDFREPKTVAGFFQHMRILAYEKVVFAFLNEHGNCLGTIAYRGGEHHCSIVLREIVAAALLSGAKAVVNIHNHISVYVDGNLNFSQADIDVFDQLHWQLSIFQIDFLDMVLISANYFTSYREQQAEAERKKKLNSYQRGALLETSHELPPEIDHPMFIIDTEKEPAN